MDNLENFKSIHLPQVIVEKGTTRKGDIYFVIKSQEENNRNWYFCFENKLKQDWNDLLKNYSQITSIEIEYEEIENPERPNPDRRVCAIINHNLSRGFIV